jgi:DNA-binding winged helix-turn-helix (wHTH) protein/tetratricopeptide (TPR) repeat protein
MRETAEAYQFGPFRLLPAEGVLLRGQEIVPLPVKALAVLTLLVRNHGRVVQKNELIRYVWPDCFVEDNNLTQNISAVRRALGDAQDEPQYVETVPRRGYRFVGDVTELEPGFAEPRPPVASEHPSATLGILPFRTIGADCADFWGVGMADALINRLTGVENIRVRPTASILRYDGLTPDWAVAGRELKVDTLLSGCIQRSSERIRVSVQLISVQDGTTLWARQFDDSFTDIFAVEDYISSQVVQTLAPRLTGADAGRVNRRDTGSTAAHRAYLKGRYFWNRRNEEDLRKSVQCFEEAVELDPAYALAYVGLADAYTVLGGYGDMAPAECYPRARAAALRALDIDGGLEEAHIPLGDVAMYYDWDAHNAERQYRQALDARPDYATAHHFFAWYLIGKGRFADAAREMQRAQEIDPLSPIINAQTGLPDYFARRYDRAIQIFQQAMEMHPQFAVGYVYLGRACAKAGRFAEAIEVLRQGVSLSHRRPFAVASLSYALASAGALQEADSLLQELLASAGRRYTSPYYVAVACAGLERHAEAMRWLHTAHAERANQLVISSFEPMLDPLRSRAEFTDLMASVGFAA